MNQNESSLQLPRSAARALTLLDHVVTAGQSTLTEAAEAADLPVSTSLRHLLVMQQAGFLERDTNGIFSAGPEFLRLALHVSTTGPHARLTEIAHAHLQALSQTTEESTYLAIRDGSMAIYTACVESTRAVRHVGWVGHTVPIANSAVGAALTSLERDGEPVVRTAAVEPDVTAVAAPIFAADTAPIAAISVIGPSGRLAGERLDIAIRASAAARAAIETELTSWPSDKARPTARNQEPG